MSHQSKQNIATKEFSDLQMVYSEEYFTRREAELREIQLKKWSKAKKKALIDGKLTLLKALSKNHEHVED